MSWGGKWLAGGYLKDILEETEILGSKRRPEYSFNRFRAFVEAMGMKDFRVEGQKMDVSEQYRP